MSFNKAIESGSEHRKCYRDSRKFDHTCRNHGSCDYCRSRRTHFDRKYRSIVNEQYKNWLRGKHD